MAILVLNYNGADHLGYSIPSIERAMTDRMQLIFIENCSQDGGLTHFNPTRNWLVVSLQSNLGWAGGNNCVLRRFKRFKYFVLLNNDIALHQDSLAAIRRAFEANPDHGVIGLRVYEGGNRPTDCEEYQAALQAYDPNAWRTLIAARVVGGMAMGVRGACIDDVGHFDEAFFAYGDEVDFLRRVHRSKWKTATIDIPVWHFGGGGFRSASERAMFLQIRANMLLACKHLELPEVIHSAFRFLRRFRSTTPIEAYGVESRIASGPRVQRFYITFKALLSVVGDCWGVLLVRLRFRNVIVVESSAAKRERLRLEAACSSP